MQYVFLTNYKFFVVEVETIYIAIGATNWDM